ncbi:NEK protein kinase [Coniosporium apollinis CBS 100218]|uniref:NEK protein kinase n=1 Tax=Coniosporium apollinis (strain CBS 100218) TaxID=1168221 RepID=R7YR88_CONA1|nr:NEK protein kinase [Coniosporium apollinis CBS 100218]EON64432.1 NEK protein kinase [Coniosporium apollinis CBS 100218]
MLCHRRFTPKEALEEVRHLQALNHGHVVRLVGSYAQGKHFSVLTYPVAECDLKAFLAQIERRGYPFHSRKGLAKGISCLSAAIEHIHAAGVKHMDLKPQNILVEDSNCPSVFKHPRFYITDFGISRFVQDLEASETDGFSQRTLMYCSPEVAAEQPRGRSSDIFSLGCVFAEMLTCMACRSQAEFRSYRADDGETFHKNLPQVVEWIDDLPADYVGIVHLLAAKKMTELEPQELENTEIIAIKRMLQQEPKDRPTAADLVKSFPPWFCCSSGSEPFVRVA